MNRDCPSFRNRGPNLECDHFDHRYQKNQILPSWIAIGRSRSCDEQLCKTETLCGGSMRRCCCRREAEIFSMFLLDRALRFNKNIRLIQKIVSDATYPRSKEDARTTADAKPAETTNALCVSRTRVPTPCWLHPLQKQSVMCESQCAVQNKIAVSNRPFRMTVPWGEGQGNFAAPAKAGFMVCMMAVPWWDE